ncbi:cation:proton antiporter [Dactylosporangium sp. NPDC048998]|uniref:cation:proton antiporter n=1 Tax=Dactylosporangium sp. NPDC048998 TaxID=3363976 RepID=UPI00370FF407
MSPAPPLAAPALLLFLLQIGTLLALAVLLGRLAARLGMPQIVGELCAGVLLGPSLLGHVAPDLSGWLFPAKHFDMLDGVGQLGMLLLVGVTGMYLDIGLLRRQGVRAAAVSVPSLILPLGLGVALGFVLPAAILPPSGDRTLFAMFLGVALCVSALPVIAKILTELGFLHRDLGQLTIISASVDDVAGWLLLSVVTAMATTGVHAGTVATSVALLAGIVLFAVVVLRPAVKVVLRATARSAEPGVTVAVVAVLVLLCAAGTQALRMEALLGAFLCGVVVASTGLVDPARLAPLRTVVLNVLAPVFFATAGLRIDLTALARPAVAATAVAVIAVAVAGKFAGAFLGATLIRMDRWSAFALGAGLNARGVVQIVVASVGLHAGVLSTDGYTVVVLVAIVTSVMAPPLLRLALGRIETSPAERERELALAGRAT